MRRDVALRQTARARPAAAAPVTPKPKEHESAGLGPESQGFRVNEYVIYPAHGLGKIIAIENQAIAGEIIELFLINFIKDKMTLRVPTAKIALMGVRKLAEPTRVEHALDILKGPARVRRAMGSRRAQEYEVKINSGDIVTVAEVVRDLHRSDTQPEQSHSEQQIYGIALDRLSSEIAAVQRITETEALFEIESALRGEKYEPSEATHSETAITIAKEAAGADLASAVPLVAAARAQPELLAELLQHGFSEDEVFSLVIPKRTLARRRAGHEPLTVEETDKALRLRRTAVLAEKVFGEPAKAHRWLRKPKRALNGETPVAFLASEEGARIVEEMLYRIDHGMAA